MFATDRDLLLFEPDLLRDIAWAGQRLVNGTGGVAGTTLTLTAQDVDLAAAGVGAGFIVSVDGVSYEIIERLSATTATLSRLRAGAADPTIPPSPVSAKPVQVVTFRPQIALVHAQVLRLLGVRAGSPTGGLEEAFETQIVNAADLRDLEACGAMHLIFAAASALSEPGSMLKARAEHYRRRFAHERQTAAAELDLDGDGIADATRRLNVAHVIRA